MRGPAENRLSGGNGKGHSTLATHALPRAARRAPEPVSKSDLKSALSRPDAKETLRLVLAGLEDIKAEDSVTIDLTGKTSIGDYMVVTSGRSARHVSSVADSVVKAVEKAGVRGVRVEGQKQADWVLIDAGDIIVHVFRPEVREFYNLEKMWSGGRPRE